MTPETSENLRTKRPAGFTMLEMLVAMAITLIIILFINQIFSSVKDAVTNGVALSSVIENGRILSGQLHDDADAMVNNSAGGFLIIYNDKINGVQPTPDYANSSLPTVRSDQLAFVRLRNNLEPMCPGTLNSYSNTVYAPYVRVWYGTGLRTKADGSDPGSTALGNANSGDNRYSRDWILCRQALFLCDTSPGGTHATGAKYNASVTNYSGSPLLYQGYSDVEYGQTLQDIDADIISGNANGLNYIFTGGNRLRVNPAPDLSISNGRDYSSQQVAQMHPLFVPNVPEFIVDFAGDYDNDGKVDTDSAGKIKWYDRYTNPPGVPVASNGFVFAPGSSKWPYMVRVRFRVTDPTGKVNGADGSMGRQFEQIITIRRD